MNLLKRHKKAVLSGITAITIAFSGYMVTANMPYEVELTVDGQKQILETNRKSLKELLEENGYDLENLHTTSDLEKEVEANTNYSIDTKKDITFNNEGETLTISTYSNTVNDLLNEYSINADTDDFVSPSKDSNIKSGDIVTYDNIVIENYSTTKEIEYNTKEEKSFDVNYGEKEVKVEGQYGSKTEQYTKITKNGEIVSDRLVNETINSEAVEEVVLVGTKEIVQESVTASTEERANSSMYEGQTKVVQEARDGIIEYTYENDGEERVLISEETKVSVQNKIVEYGTKSRPAATNSSRTVGKYSLRDLKYQGIINWNGLKFTYYSQSVLPGGGLRIPGRHVNSGGYVADSNGYIVVAHRNAAIGSVINTPFGYQAKVYDRCGNCALNHYDVYTK